jgi:pyridoxamine 5'-phosphate oxidase family protein
MFTEAEKAYLLGQRLARIATVSPGAQPDVAPVSFRFDGERFYVGGFRLARTLKYKNVRANELVALVVDDWESVDPWHPRGVKVHGRAEVIETSAGRGALRVTPETKWSWGINRPVFVTGDHGDYVMDVARAKGD